jgi:preprotein translocase subunit YajC
VRNIQTMLEFILLFIFFYFIINGFSKRKARRKPRTLDAELREGATPEAVFDIVVKS